MKKTLKVLLLVAFLSVMLFALTGCGNKLVATKESEDPEMGKMKERIEISFKKDKVNEVKMQYTFKDKETAEKAEKQFNAMLALMTAFSDEEVGMEVKRSGKKVVMELDAEAFAEMMGEDVEDLEVSKEELKESLEEEGYKVK